MARSIRLSVHRSESKITICHFRNQQQSTRRSGYLWDPTSFEERLHSNFLYAITCHYCMSEVVVIIDHALNHLRYALPRYFLIEI